MSKTKEETLFNRLNSFINSRDEVKLEGCHIYDNSTEERKSIRVDCKLGSFDSYMDDDQEEYNIDDDEWYWTGTPYYGFSGLYHDDYPEVKIRDALTFVNGLRKLQNRSKKTLEELS